MGFPDWVSALSWWCQELGRNTVELWRLVYSGYRQKCQADLEIVSASLIGECGPKNCSGAPRKVLEEADWRRCDHPNTWQDAGRTLGPWNPEANSPIGFFFFFHSLPNAGRSDPTGAVVTRLCQSRPRTTDPSAPAQRGHPKSTHLHHNFAISSDLLILLPMLQ